MENFECSSKTPLITVIVPMYRVEKYIVRCIESILSQTLKDIEIILIDDCGNDKSVEIAKKYANQDSRIRLIQNDKNRGQGYSRNIGLKLARAPYVAFVDADDWVERDAYEVLYKQARQKDSEITLCGFNTIFLDNVLKCCMNDFCEDFSKTYKAEDNPVKLLGLLMVVVWNGIYKKDFLMSNNLFFDETKKGEDLMFSWKSRLLAEKIAFVPKELYNYNKCNALQDTRAVSYIINILNIIYNELKPFILDKPQYHNAFILYSYKTLEWLYTKLDSNWQKLKHRKLYMENILSGIHTSRIEELGEHMTLYPILRVLKKGKFSYFEEFTYGIKLFLNCYF